jgi:hypothetical protein
VVLYELLTGTTPLDRQRLRRAPFTEMMRLIREEEPPRPSTRLSQSGEALTAISAQRKTEPAKLPKLMRGELDWIVMKALAKDRARRYETANGLARDLQRYLADEPVEACPPSAGYRLRKFLRKHRAGVLTAGAFAVLLAVGAAVSAWMAVRATLAETRARAEQERAVQAAAEARAERDRAVALQKRADHNFALARKAVEDYLRTVAGDPDLKDRADFTGVRKRLLESAIPFYEKFAEQQSNDPRQRAEGGRAWLQLGQVRWDSGDRTAAARAFARAREVLLRVAAEQPTNFDYRLDLLQAYLSLAAVNEHMGRPGESRRARQGFFALAKSWWPTSRPNRKHVTCWQWPGSTATAAATKKASGSCAN